MFFFDENLPPWLAKGMKEFGEDAVHISQEFEGGTEDEVWLPVIGGRGWFLISRDRRIRTRPAELKAYRTHRVGGFVLTGKDVNGWGIVEQVVRNWRRIKELAYKTERPFLFKVPPKGTTIDRLSL